MTTELELLRNDINELRNLIEILETSVQGKVSNEDIKNVITIVDSQIDDFNATITTLNTTIVNLGRLVAKIKNTSTAYTREITITNPVAENLAVTLAYNVTNTTEYTTSDYSRALRFAFTDWDATTKIKVTGVDQFGREVIEYASVNGYSLNAFYSITEIDTTQGTQGSVDIYWSNKLGTSVNNISSLLRYKLNNVITAKTELTLDTSYGTVLFATLPDGSNDYQLLLVSS